MTITSHEATRRVPVTLFLVRLGRHKTASETYHVQNGLAALFVDGDTERLLDCQFRLTVET